MIAFVVLGTLVLNFVLCANELFIDSMAALIDFSNDVNDGNTFSGTTVFLSTDLDFTGLSSRLNPIGYGTSSGEVYFAGTFDGQGYMISDLIIESSSLLYMGLFGCTHDATIRNVVMGPTCSIASSLSVTGVLTGIGGVVGYCSSEKSECLLQSLVNMATISFTGSITSNSYVGGVIGRLHNVYDIKVFNCANYGDIIHAGHCESVVVGGVVGNTFTSNYNMGKTYIKNCLNFGTIDQSVWPNLLIEIGGIIGGSYFGRVENCVAMGTIRSNESSSEMNRAHGILGYDSGKSEITHCFWTNYNGNENTEIWYTNDFNTPTSSGKISTLNVSFVNELIEYSESYEWNKWLLNDEGKNVTFRINGGKGFSVSTQLILLPDLADSEGLTFSGWFSDESCSVLYKSVTVEEDMTLYGGWKFTVTFNPKEGTVSPETKSVTFGNLYGELPKAVKEGSEFVVWSSADTGTDIYNHTTVTLRHSHVLDANWNTSSVFFDPTGGNSDTSSKGVTMGREYGTLPIPERTGYDFDGWYTEMYGGGIRINETSIVETDRDHTLYANWTIIYYSFTFDFLNGSVEYRYFTYGEHVSYPNDPVMEGYEFYHWSKVVDTMPDNDEEAYAIWTPNRYNLTFDFGNGTLVTQEYECGQEVQIPDNLEREGHEFAGWNETFERMPGHNVVISVVWNVMSYELVLDFGNGTTVTLNVEYGYPVSYPTDLVRDGYEFNGWNNTVDNMPAHKVTSFAQWEYIAESSGRKVPGGSSGIIPIESSGKVPGGSSGGKVPGGSSGGKVPGGSSGGVPMESSKTTDRKKGNSNSLIVILVVLLLVLLIAIAVILALIFIAYTRAIKEKEGNDIPLAPIYVGGDERRRRDLTMSDSDDTLGDVANEPEMCKLNELYPKGYTKPPLKNALCEAGLTDAQADQVCDASNGVAERAKTQCKLFDGLTQDDAAGIAMYTYKFDLDNVESSPFRIINRAFIANDPEDLKKIAGLLCLFMTALRRLPRVSNVTLYRGIRGNAESSKGQYSEGSVVVWPALTSASPDVKATKSSLMSGTGEGTLFIIENAWGYNIQPYSLNQDEVEIIIEPGMQFTVQSVVETEGITIITLRMIDTPTIQTDAWK